MKHSLVLPFIALLVLLAACDNSTDASAIRVRVRVDGTERVLTSSESMSVRQLLQKENIRTGDLDRLNPSDFTPILDGMVITIVRVENRA
ncbi:MAG TPA: ubiquitin-like domain-containing protein, partial [Aggregatilineales bacterium]|nr:ubiquitin-like domain-containing protein [Aggregatilineales bacterium]